MPKQLKDIVVKNESLASDIYRLTIESEYISKNAVPGQFVNIKCSEGFEALLRRPISICSADCNKGTYDIIFRNKGIGTSLLANKKKGDALDVLGPLGNGFSLDFKYTRIAVVGGGIGIFPLLFILKESKAAIKKAYIGFRTKEQVILEEEFKQWASSLEIATDDGSYGYEGVATDLLKRDIGASGYDIIYSCGPMPMMKKATEIASAEGISIQVSLEQRMGCGFGACLACACKTKALEGGWQFSHVCKDGPVFDGRTVIFDADR